MGVASKHTRSSQESSKRFQWGPKAVCTLETLPGPPQGRASPSTEVQPRRGRRPEAFPPGLDRRAVDRSAQIPTSGARPARFRPLGAGFAFPRLLGPSRGSVGPPGGSDGRSFRRRPKSPPPNRRRSCPAYPWALKGPRSTPKTGQRGRGCRDGVGLSRRHLRTQPWGDARPPHESGASAGWRPACSFIRQLRGPQRRTWA
jgi:hypothetical protein